MLNVRGFWPRVVLVMDSSVCVCADRFLDSIGGFTPLAVPKRLRREG